MKRITKLIKHLEKEMKAATNKWIKQLEQAGTTNVKKVIQEAFTKAPSNSQVVITYLRSSAITESHKFKLAIYQTAPFVDKPIYQRLINMKPLFADVPEEAQALVRKASPPFFHIIPFEKEEIKRNYTVRLYQQSYHFFDRAIKEMEIDNQQITVYFGEEMGGLITLGASKTIGASK